MTVSPAVLCWTAEVNGVKLYCTLLPSMPHFARFARDPRMAGIRLNTPMLDAGELQQEFKLLTAAAPTAEMFFDVKGRQLRVLQAHDAGDHLELVINHPVSTPEGSLVLFKAGGDQALLDHVTEDGFRLVFHGGPKWLVKPGESLHIVDEGFAQHGDLFNDWELSRIKAAKAAGFNRYLLSYTESMADVERLQEIVGKDAQIWLKIESQKGLRFVREEFVKSDNLTLVAARGDLFVELRPPHLILEALRLIISRDPEAVAGSRILLSVVNDPLPSCADLSELAWLREIGYRQYMLCDELCLEEGMLARAVNVFEAVADSYMPWSNRKEPATGFFSRLVRGNGKHAPSRAAA